VLSALPPVVGNRSDSLNVYVCVFLKELWTKDKGEKLSDPGVLHNSSELTLSRVLGTPRTTVRSSAQTVFMVCILYVCRDITDGAACTTVISTNVIH
jgi:hypothetical protein